MYEYDCPDGDEKATRSSRNMVAPEMNQVSR